MHLKKAIYGLKQAALAWWKALDKSMATLSCKQLVSDSGISSSTMSMMCSF